MLVRCWLSSLLGALLLVALPALARPLYAHAGLVRSEPAANAQLAEPPHEIRLWFSEPLEPAYSSVEVRGASGATISTPPSYVEPTDDHQLVLMAGELPDGLYTVAWRNVSSADGHQQVGSFAFIVGAAGAAIPDASTETAGLSVTDVIARWINFWGLALAVGSIAFRVFVWLPAMQSAPHPSDAISVQMRPLWDAVWIGWVAAGVGAVLLFLNQTAILLGKAPAEVFAWESLIGVIQSTRFGSLWLWRMALWLVMGVLLLAAPRRRAAAWAATLCGLAMLLPVSMHSHAAVGSDGAISIFSDWIHLVMTALWVGGLAQFLLAIGALQGMSRRTRPTKRNEDAQPLAVTLGEVTAHFSNYARVAVAGLVVTGIYATWHQVNTLEGLTTTLYGQLLVAKLALVVVLLAVAAVNLVWTQRRLLAGQALWVGRLRALVALELLLTFAILLVAGGMTSITPARSEMALREAAAAIPPAPAEQPVHMVEDVDDLQIHFTVTPGWVGNSTFVIQLVNRRDGSPVTDASLIRMRFEHADANLGESELQIRPEAPAADGVYSTEGANLSAVGDWNLRMTVQRPGEFDSIADLSFNMVEPPPPPPAPVVDDSPALRYRTPVFLLSGILALLCGIYALVSQRFRLLQGASLAGVLLLLLGAAFLLGGLR